MIALGSLNKKDEMEREKKRKKNKLTPSSLSTDDRESLNEIKILTIHIIYSRWANLESAKRVNL